MQALVGGALNVVTNPFESAGKLVDDPVGALQGTVGMGLASITDLLNVSTKAVNSGMSAARQNMLGYSIAVALVMWIYWQGVYQQS